MRIITQLSTLDRWRRPSARAWSHLGRVLRCEALWKRSGSAKVGGRRRARARCCQVDWRPLRPTQRCTSPSKIARRSNCSRWRCTPASRRRWPCGTRHERDWEGGGDGDAARPLTRAISRARPARSVGSGKTCCGSSRIHAFARRRSSPSGANGTSRFKYARVAHSRLFVPPEP